MGTAITTEFISIKEVKAASRLEKRIHHIFNKVVSGGMDLKQMRTRLRGTVEVNVVFIKKGRRDIGFGMASYYRAQLGSKSVFFVRPAMGVVEGHRGGIGRQALKQYMASYLKFKLRHPFSEIYLFSAPVSPIVYAGTAKYWKECYPKYNLAAPSRITSVKMAALERFGLDELRNGILKHAFSAKIDEKDLKRFKAARRKNPHVAYFFKKNPNFLEDEGLILIVPINFKNLIRILLGRRY